MYRDDVIKRDMDEIRRINPHTLSLEDWMRKNKYTGEVRLTTLKNSEDGKALGLNHERVAEL